MSDFSSSIFRGARVFAAVLHHNVTDIDVRYDVAVNSDILPNDESLLAAENKSDRVRDDFYAKKQEKRVLWIIIHIDVFENI